MPFLIINSLAWLSTRVLRTGQDLIVMSIRIFHFSRRKFAENFKLNNDEFPSTELFPQCCSQASCPDVAEEIKPAAVDKPFAPPRAPNTLLPFPASFIHIFINSNKSLPESFCKGT